MATGQIEHETEWLPRLAPLLPIEVPVPIAIGQPAEGYPYPWLVFRWLEGDDLQSVRDLDFDRLARDLAAFRIALASVDATGAPLGGRHGGRMHADDTKVRACIHLLRKQIDADRALSIWKAALDAGPWGGAPVWVHGDLLPGNIIVAPRICGGIASSVG